MKRLMILFCGILLLTGCTDIRTRLLPESAAASGLLHLLFGILLPWGIVLIHRRDTA